MFTSLFWKDTGERVLVTFLEALLALFLIAPTTTLLTFDWPSALALSGTAALISLLKALVAGNVKRTVSPASLAVDDRGV